MLLNYENWELFVEMLLGGGSLHQASSNELFSEAKTLSDRGLARIARTSRVCPFRFEFRYRGVVRRGFSKICGLEPDTATLCRICVRAGVEVSKKEAAVQKQTQKKHKDVEYDTGTPSGRRRNDMVFVDRSHKHFGKDFSVLAELLPVQDRNSASSIGGQQRSVPKHDPGRLPNQSVGSVRTMEDVLKSWSSEVENNVCADSESNETLSKRNSSREDDKQLQNRQIGGRKFLVESGKPRKAPEEQSIDSPVAKVRVKEKTFGNTFGSAKGTTEGRKDDKISQASPRMSVQSSETIVASRQSPAEASPKVEKDAMAYKVEKPSLRGLDILLAMQNAAMEKAKHKQRNRSASVKAVKVKENALPQETLDWRDARPIVIRPEWALQIESLEGRIKDLRKQMQTL